MIHRVSVRGWIDFLVLIDKDPAAVSFSARHARIAVMKTYLRPIAYFGADPLLSLEVRGRDARVAAKLFGWLE